MERVLVPQMSDDEAAGLAAAASKLSVAFAELQRDMSAKIPALGIGG